MLKNILTNVLFIVKSYPLKFTGLIQYNLGRNTVLSNPLPNIIRTSALKSPLLAVILHIDSGCGSAHVLKKPLNVAPRNSSLEYAGGLAPQTTLSKDNLFFLSNGKATVTGVFQVECKAIHYMKLVSKCEASNLETPWRN
jgi:hypothetical protein